ncbi:MAG: DUF192 domain-containing protein [Cardiobacteriaceae bacterium]|nr:DUF192 domain-containing protein [Cardiobacteriaceae bacterium]
MKIFQKTIHFTVFLLSTLFIHFSECKKANLIVFDGENYLAAEIADSPEKRAQGLMFRMYLPSFSAMLFQFEEEQAQSAFWMKNTLIDLNISFYSQDGKLTARHLAIPCAKVADLYFDQCPLYPSYGKILFVLETNPRAQFGKNIKSIVFLK